ncbi:MAG: hypothetical protein B5766_01385 [Candidatus Lumbricidophila eiseniae]|uniref:HTH lacI-type domain-containing protein n=1 Tax=Candidatus Lumbricidiphila eiseniae TaxID=1969409 RepID=A0A2A6FUR7_9MICO|nr:MAG: hypothetical protein B5766_01385 [Candidatus Lumbricidophila eiseniae]
MPTNPVNPRRVADAGGAGGAGVPTSADVARRANVSRATASYVLNGVTSQKISEKTRNAVRLAAAELGYRPNLAAQSLATGASKIVLFVIPYVHLGELATLISSHLTARTAEQGMTVIVHFEGPASRAVIDAARDLRPRLVLSMFSLDDETATWLRERDIMMTTIFPDTGLATAVNEPPEWLQVEYLVGIGHRQIGYADTCEPGLAMLAQMRHRGVVDACRARSLPAPAYEQFSLDGAGAEHKVRSWVAGGVSAVAAYNDEVAITVLAGIRRAGLRCPEDLAVIGVDEMAINGSMEPPLSSIEFDTDAIAVHYAEVFADILNGRETPRREASSSRFLRVVERESTGMLRRHPDSILSRSDWFQFSKEPH